MLSIHELVAIDSSKYHAKHTNNNNNNQQVDAKRHLQSFYSASLYLLAPITFG